MHHVVFCFESDVYEVICHRGAVEKSGYAVYTECKKTRLQ